MIPIQASQNIKIGPPPASRKAGYAAMPVRSPTFLNLQD